MNGPLQPFIMTWTDSTDSGLPGSSDRLPA